MAQKNVINLKGDKLHSNLTNGAALKRGDHAGFFFALHKVYEGYGIYSERKIMCIRNISTEKNGTFFLDR